MGDLFTSSEYFRKVYNSISKFKESSQVAFSFQTPFPTTDKIRETASYQSLCKIKCDMDELKNVYYSDINCQNTREDLEAIYD